MMNLPLPIFSISYNLILTELFFSVDAGEDDDSNNRTIIIIIPVVVIFGLAMFLLVLFRILKRKGKQRISTGRSSEYCYSFLK